MFYHTIPEIQEIIGYDIPVYKVGNDHFYLVAYKKHIRFILFMD